MALLLCLFNHYNNYRYENRSERSINRALHILQAKPESFNGLHGYRILHENGSGFLIVNRSGKWQFADDHHVDADLLVDIGLALEGQSIDEQVVIAKTGSLVIISENYLGTWILIGFIGDFLM